MNERENLESQIKKREEEVENLKSKLKRKKAELQILLNKKEKLKDMETAQFNASIVKKIEQRFGKIDEEKFDKFLETFDESSLSTKIF